MCVCIIDLVYLISNILIILVSQAYDIWIETDIYLSSTNFSDASYKTESVLCLEKYKDE